MRRPSRRPLAALPLVLGVSLAMVASARAGDIFVAANGSGDVATLAEAARVAAPGDRLILGDGVHPASSVTRTRITEPISILSASGDAAACTLDGEGAAYVLSYDAVDVEASQRGGGFVLSDVTITGALDGAVRVFGGASPEIVGCVFVANGGSLWGAIHVDGGSTTPLVVRDSAFRSNHSDANGSAILRLSGALVLNGCEFTDNDGDGGGAVVHLGGAGSATTTLLENCLFERNTGRIGGGLYALVDRVTIHGSVFRRNEVTFTGGGAFVSLTSDDASELVDCEFEQNVSLLDGGGLYLAARTGTPAQLDGVVFAENAAPRGGGLFVEAGAADLSSCLFVDNAATGTDGDRGEGGALRVLGDGTVSLLGCTLSGNVATRLGGAVRSHGRLTMDASTFVGNSALDGSDFSLGGPTTIVRTLVARGHGASVHCEGGPLPNVSCSNFVGNDVVDWPPCIEDLLPTNGNLRANPLFCDVDPSGHRSWRLREGSPCLTAACGPIGAWATSCGTAPILERSWAAIRNAYRVR